MGNAFKKPGEVGTKSFTQSTGDKRKITLIDSVSTSFFSNWSLRSNKSIRSNYSASLTRSSKTKYPRPSNITIFSSHFKLSNRDKHFHYCEEIAQGSYGTVIKVIDHELKQSFALKVLKKSTLVQENFIDQIKNEVDIHKICSHHFFIVPFIDCWQGRRNIYILMELVPRGELFSKICMFSFDLIRVYVAEIALAIDFLHNAGIIYRDLKPENILLDEKYHIKIIDFGLSKWLKFGSRTKTICGTLQYMAPEILRQEYYDHNVDWWSLGIVTCRMLMNDYPDVRLLINEEFWNQMQSKNDLQSKMDFYENFFPNNFYTIPLEAQDLLRRLLEFNPSLRLNSVLKLKRIGFFKGFNFDLESLRTLLPKLISEEKLIDCVVPVYV